eukprot:TRINITY_DN38110_c0_g1_i1.p1 TRINITY_DN38110_c0_g1~~TRINITY_DN38110_c0_g1_i1.p1  ORF type:complete len:1085 (+),score=160.81 TRINITY_DN38110_c0_g1_i1:53-3256(+)
MAAFAPQLPHIGQTCVNLPWRRGGGFAVRRRSFRYDRRRGASGTGCTSEEGIGFAVNERRLISSSHKSWNDAVRVFMLLNTFRRNGHLTASLDPLRGSLHRQLSPKETINWRVGGYFGQTVGDMDLAKFLNDYPANADLEIFNLGAYALDDPLPEGVGVPPFWGPPPCGEPGGAWTFRSFIDHLRRCYTEKVSMEHMHISDKTAREWLQERLEGRFVEEQNIDVSERAKKQREALLRVIRTTEFERLLSNKYPSVKAFGIVGCEALIPGLWALLETAVEEGVKQFVMGMSHRGRLNVLVNFLGKDIATVCSEFDEQIEVGDVKYHLGTSVHQELTGRDGHRRVVQLTLASNPSHLEAVNPVVLGMTRAKMDHAGDKTRRSVASLLLHGDASFSGQGIVSESMQLSELNDYTTGGTIHIVINNLVGFTTDPREARSTYHCTNVAKIIDAPILHVNADDVDAVLYVFKLAAEFRQIFCKDIVIDLVCYRRKGHSEQDDPGCTQPLSAAAVAAHPPVVSIYSDKLVAMGITSEDEVDAWKQDACDAFEAGYRNSLNHEWDISEWRVSHWDKRPVNATGLPETFMKLIGRACSRFPPDAALHPKVVRVFKNRLRLLDEGVVDLALAEQLALGALSLDFDPGMPDTFPGDEYIRHPACDVRLSGQDVERGTFNQRHAAVYDQLDATRHCVFDDMNLGHQRKVFVCNSSLSEFAILGFEYGYSLERALALTIWEAQFGDFANGAQPIIDNFIAAGESKWGAKSCVVLMLPHGMEGQGPEHSSARIERFLQLVNDDPDDPLSTERMSNLRLVPIITKASTAALVQEAIKASANDDANGTNEFDEVRRRIAALQERIDSIHNLCVANPTTPANFFHVLRRQVHRTFAKPLILFTAKYLHHHRPCRSPFRDMGPGTRFQRLIMEGKSGDNMIRHTTKDAECKDASKKRLIFCSGKVFYDLHHARLAKKMETSVALARIEQLAPFPALYVAVCAGRYPEAEIVWVQEEPKNMGAWNYVGPRIAAAVRDLLPDGCNSRSIRYVGRPSAARPATALFRQHKVELRRFIDAALKLPNDAD